MLKSSARSRRAKLTARELHRAAVGHERPVFLPNEGLVKLRTALALFPVSRASWWRGIRDGRYPAPVRLGQRSVAWRVQDLRRLIAECGSSPAPSSDSSPTRLRARRKGAAAPQQTAT